MFRFYGGKIADAHRYAPPRHDTIIEPFAGGAGYACHWLMKGAAQRAVLVDADPLVIDAWNRILAATPDEILAWPTPILGERSSDLLATVLTGGSGLTGEAKVTPRMIEHFPEQRRRIAWLRGHIGDRVDVRHGDYTTAPDIPATWFVDPPYETQGRRYRMNGSAIDYGGLAAWCRTRQGQVIVCEAEPAAWLPFRPMRTLSTMSNTIGLELIWESDPAPTLFDPDGKML